MAIALDVEGEISILAMALLDGVGRTWMHESRKLASGAESRTVKVSASKA
jgi:hypothetical protein